MAEPRGLAAALAPFHAASKHLQATQARLSALIAAVTSEAVTRTGNLERLPAAARFNPFSVAQPLNPFAVLTKVAGAANAAEAGAKAGGRRSDTGKRPAPTAAARPGANASAAAAGLASAAAGLHQAPGRAPDLPPSAAARAAAAHPEPDRTLADTARCGGAGASSADAPSVGALIDALLQRHATPAACPKAERTPARAARSGAAAAAGRAKSSVNMQSVGELINTVLQGAAPVARPEAGRTLARAARSGAAAAAGTGKALAGAPSVGELIDGLLQRHAAPRPDTRPTASAQPMASAVDTGAYLQGAPDTLRTLVAPRFLRPVPDSDAGPAKAGAQRASERLPLLRAPSRLLGTASPCAQASATAPATAKAWTAAAEPSSGQPALGQPADLAAGLERLLREQAWLRGVDLS